MTLRSRLLLAFGLLLFFLLGVSLISASQIRGMHESLDFYATTTTPALEKVRNWQTELASIRMLQGQHLMTVSEEEMGELEKTIATHFDQLQRGVAQDESQLRDEQERALWQAVSESLALSASNWEKLRTLTRESLQSPEQGEAARRLFTSKTERIYTTATKNINAYWQYTTEQASGLAQQGAKTYQLSLSILVGSFLLATALGIAAAWAVVRSVVRQVGGEPAQGVELALAIAQGRLAAHEQAANVPANSIMAAMLTMRERLASLVRDVRNTSDSVATGTAEIAAGNADLSQRTELQARDLQEAVASMERLMHTVKNTADNAQQASTLASQAAKAANDGGRSVTEVMSAMQDLATASATISDITAVIDGIAFQTNILALNAAVEAARAGEQGRGFAVVASEVRALAQRSSQAAKEIRTLLDSNVHKVQATSTKVQTAGAAITHIVGQVDQVNALVVSIRSATGTQYEGISQVGQAVARIDQSTQQNAALVEQISAAAESLRVQTQQLSQAIAFFRMEAAPTLGGTAMPALS
ncbi:MCP four helix bundle domain-containing protein [Curvibacter sp. CHRR-16]|uniref:methyl-accepting chemotaxis protein n=1 Tax=Curvibacter sp. CHRR-16 TaxID=2835872 RepID=UPI001BD96C08|nr:methyl-accepting chemotaxis protein [Curvibacter sp. CHRR-16]MBT0570748.1 MCP four helix bundle domain-containing protein [Curvibacter sp. CHRR-16]